MNLMDPVLKQSFIDYLEKHLCDPSLDRHNRWTKVGPRSFFFRDERDTIFVKVSDENLILITDGELVVDHIEMIHLNLREEDEELFNHYLQDILSLF